MTDSHRLVCILPQALAWLVFTLCTLFFYFSHGYGAQIGLFLHNATSISQSYTLDVTPASWTVYVWVVIHVWLLMWLLYALTTICRKSDEGFLYLNPPLISPVVYLAFSINQICFIATIFLVDRRYIGYSLIFLALGIFCLYICVYLLQRRVYQRGATLEQQKKMADIWLVRVLAENGIGFYATWLSIMFLYYIGVLTVYVSEYGIGQGIASVIVLVMITGEIGTWFVLDNFVMEKFSRYSVSPYLAAIVFMSAVVDNNWAPESASFIFSITLLGSMCVMLLVKLFLMFWRHGTRYFFKRDLDDMSWALEEESTGSAGRSVLQFQQHF